MSGTTRTAGLQKRRATLQMNDLYTPSFNFWRLLAAEEAEVGGSAVLANGNVPLLLSNAAWFPRADDVGAVATWYTDKGIVPALILPAVRDGTFDRALEGSGFTLEQAFTFREIDEPPEDVDLITEQVSWAQGRTLGEHLAAHYGLPAYGVQLGAAVTRAMQRSPHILSVAAYDGDEVVGALVAFEREESLYAMMASEALEGRLYQEAMSRNARALALEPLPDGVTARDGRSLERWSLR